MALKTLPEGYLESLKEKGKDKRISQEFQFIGLEVAEMLEDRPHKALYIKLAKQYGSQKILSIAKDVVDRRDIKNRGAYFMKMLHMKNDE